MEIYSKLKTFRQKFGTILLVIYMLYLLVSNSYHILDEEIKKIVKDEKYEVIDYLKTTLEDIVMEASYSDLFSNKKILIIKNATFFSTKIDTTALDKYLLNINPNTILIFTCSNIDERLKIVKTFKDSYNYKINNILYQKDIVNKLIEIAEKKDYNLSIESAIYISKSSLDNYDIAYNNLEKIFLYYNKPCKINESDVINLVSVSLEENNFKFIESVINNDTENAFKILNDLKIKKIEPLSLFNLLAREYRLMLILKEEYQKKSRSYIMKLLNIRDWQLEKLLKQASRYNREYLEDKLIEICEYDYQIKTGKIDKFLALELFILNN